MKTGIQYETGVIWQDFQHRQLIDLFEQVKQARADNREQQLFSYSAAFLAMYVNHHFTLEEEYMTRYQYPEYESHRVEHRAFIKEVKTFREKHRDFSREGVDDLLARMEAWILNHILKSDQKLGAFISEREQASASSGQRN